MKDSLMVQKLLDEYSKPKRTSPVLDICRCGSCYKVMLTKNAIEDYGYHDGWEMKPYSEYLCPYCEDGYIEDFWASNKSVKEYNKIKGE